MYLGQVNYGDLLQAIQESCKEMGLQPVDSFVAKCIQLYETTLVRHGLMLVGPTMGGKTVCYRVLQKVCPYRNAQCFFYKASHCPRGYTYVHVENKTHW